MKIRNTVVLVAIFALLMGYVYLVEMKREPVGEEAEGRQVISLEAEAIQRLEVKGGENKVQLLKDENGVWHLREPIDEEADSARVNDLVDRLASLMARRIITEPPEELATFGLETPRLEVEIGLSEGLVEVFLIRNKNPQGSAYYVRRPRDATIYLIDTEVINDPKRLIDEPPMKHTPTPLVTATSTPEVTRMPTFSP